MDKDCLVRTRDGSLWVEDYEGLGNRWVAYWSERSRDAISLERRIAESIAADVWAVVVNAATGEVIANFDPRKESELLHVFKKEKVKC